MPQIVVLPPTEQTISNLRSHLIRRHARTVVIVAVAALYFLVAGAAVFAITTEHSSWVGIAEIVGAAVAVFSLFGAIIARQVAGQRQAEENDARQQSRILTRLLKGAMAQRRQLLDLNTAVLQIRFRLDRENYSRSAAEMSRVLLDHRRVVLIGPAGSGKSVIANELQLDLLEVADDGYEELLAGGIGRVLPMVMSLSQWEDDSIPVEDWVASQLAIQAHLDESAAKVLVMRGRILPIFDGLDELDSDIEVGRAERVLSELGKWQRYNKPYPFLLICREDKWSSRFASRGVQMSAALARVLPVRDDEISRVLSGTVGASPGIEQLRKELSNEENSWLQELLSRPWVLAAALAIVSAREVRMDDWAEFAREGITPPELLQAFVEVKLEALAPSDSRQPSARAHHASRSGLTKLAHLQHFARFLRSNEIQPRIIGERQLSSRDLVLHQLWPMTGRRRALVADTGLAILMSLPGLVFLCWLLVTTAGAWGWAIFFAFVLVYGWRLLKTSQTRWIKLVSFYPQLAASPRAGIVQALAALVAGILPTIWWGWIVGVFVATTAWVVIGLTVGYGQTLSSRQEDATTPESPLNRELLVSLLAAGSLFPILAFGFTRLPGLSPVAAVCIAAIYCVAAGCTVASAPLRRYVAFILTRGRTVPFRPARFLRQAESVGLMRTAGVAYQFRHDELRVHLGSNEGEPQVGPSADARPGR